MFSALAVYVEQKNSNGDQVSCLVFQQSVATTEDIVQAI